MSAAFNFKKLIFLIIFVLMTLSVVYFTLGQLSGPGSIPKFKSGGRDDQVEYDVRKVSEANVLKERPMNDVAPIEISWKKPVVRRKDTVDNSGAKIYLEKYSALFDKNHSAFSQLNPNKADDITNWWQAAAMIDWYINTPIRYNCKRREPVGNWHICQDAPYTIKPPCLVYSFGINFDFSFDDAMSAIGCEVHSFDPSMKKKQHKRGKNSTFYDIGLSRENTDAFSPRKDIYVDKPQLWKMRTLKSVMTELGHEGRVIDVLKIDIEGHEWFVIDNMMETDVFKYIRQFMLEFHLFPDWPLKQDYVNLYKIYTRLREMGFREFAIGPHPKTLELDKFNNQGDSEFINFFFDDSKDIQS